MGWKTLPRECLFVCSRDVGVRTYLPVVPVLITTTTTTTNTLIPGIKADLTKSTFHSRSICVGIISAGLGWNRLQLGIEPS